MKIYVLYAMLTKEEYQSRFKYLVEKDKTYQFDHTLGRYVGLYAWTPKKKLLEQFLLERDEERFIIRKGDQEDDGYDSFRVFYISEKLDYYPYKCVDETNPDKFTDVYMVTTKNEYVQSVEYRNENFMEFSPRTNIDYRLFRKDIIELLDLISYTTNFDTNRTNLLDRETSTEIQERMEFAYRQIREDKTIFGNEYHAIVNNELGMLLFLFSPLFVRKEE